MTKPNGKEECIQASSRREGCSMAIDELNNNQRKDTDNLFNAEHSDNSLNYPYASGTGGQWKTSFVPLTEAETLALRRTRINRILMRKRRLGRGYRELAPRLMTIATIVLIVVASLTSGGVGAAYAYYQAQMPLLNGIAQHSLFQTTRIYDRNGNLLYELYDHQQDRGRRTYINYNDISTLLAH